jgi:hypothetical protein
MLSTANHKLGRRAMLPANADQAADATSLITHEESVQGVGC